MDKLVPISIAQINEAARTYANSQTITAGLAELKTALLAAAAIKDATKCVQCGGNGKVIQDNVAYICPLCTGTGLTEGQYRAVPKQVVYEKMG